MLRSPSARRFLESVTAGVFRSTGDGLESPAQLPGLQLWCDGLDVSTITIATGVSQWADKSGLGHHLKQATGANQPTYANGRLTFDGVNDFLKADAFTLAQPETVYFVGSQVTWTVGDSFIGDGNAVNSMRTFQSVSSPRIDLNAGASACSITSLATGVNAVVSLVYNGAASSSRVNRAAAVTGNVGTASANGFTLGAAGDGSFPANITVSEVLIFAAAHDTNTQNRVILWLGRKFGIAV